METPFTIKESLRYGWSTMKLNLPPFVALGIATLVIGLLRGALARPLHMWMPATATILGIAADLAQAAIALMALRAALLIHDGREVTGDTIRPTLRLYLGYLAVSILYGLAVAIGFVLLVIPGLYAAVRYGFAPLLVVDREIDAFTAMERSSRLTEGYRYRLFELGLVLFGINLLGALAFGVGLVFTLPATTLAAVQVYRQLDEAARSRIVRVETRDTGAFTPAQPTV